ncbi:MAG TPA: M1 family aminopeptidase [Bryobacteraceae bacterium]
MGIASLISTFIFFPMSAEQLTAKRIARRDSKRKAGEQEDEEPVRHAAALTLPRVAQIFGSRAIGSQLVSLTRMRFLNIVREIPFWAIALIMLVLAVLNARQAGHFRGSSVWPVTYLMAEVVSGSSSLFLYVIATLYAGELIWRERDVHFDQIHDALPAPSWVNWFSQFLSLAFLEFILVTIVMFCGIAVQASLGYFNFELPVYFKELYLIVFPGVLTFILFALFVQTMLANKFAGHAVVIGLALLVPILYRYGLENRLYLFGEISPYTYSDMNGYGHYVPAVLWSMLYWFFCMAILAVLSIALARRGTDLGIVSRWRQSQERGLRLTLVAVLFALGMAASGGWFYYNGHVLNRFRTSKQTRELQADYERKYKKFERTLQPKVTAVEAVIDIYPERRSLSGHGTYTLSNPSSQPIPEVHLTTSKEAVSDVRFDRPAQQTLDDKKLEYSIYKLEKPLMPGENTRMDFKVAYSSHGFRDGNERAELAYNGTFFDRDYFPTIGYDDNVELSNPVHRRDANLPVQEELAPPGDAYYKNVNLFTPDSEWITYRTVVSTSPDQIAIAPGYLRREWTENGRRYFEYDMGGTRINNFFSYVSGRYAVKHDKWRDVNLEIYYHPGHEYNLDRMLEASKKGLEYFGQAFGPYQFQQFRILEFPRYRTFAQSFPNTVPYSEAIGFIQRVERPDDLDMVFYVTAHELAHQWWGHQLIGSRTQGSNMMSETLAQYSALMIMEKEYGPRNMRKFLKHELDTYLRGRGSEVRKEPPLALVQNEPYVWYNKGSLVMYALRDYIGEDRVNAALRKYLEQNRYSNAPYPDTRGFVAALRDAAPPEMKYLIGDMFESIVLFDNKAVSATYTPAPDHKYKVTLTVSAVKRKADGQGAESDMPLNDLIDIGVFNGPKDNEKPLYLAKHRLTQKTTSLVIIVDELPTRAGIDPYNKLIDRNPEDNVMSVSK